MSDTMIEQEATIVAKDGEHVWAETLTRSACSSCGSSGHCGTSVLGSVFKARRNRMRFINRPGLEVGDAAVVAMPPGDLIRAALLAYLTPLLAMLVAAIAASQQGLQDAGVLAWSMAGLLAGLALVRGIGRVYPGYGVRVTLLPAKLSGSEQTVQFIHH